MNIIIFFNIKIEKKKNNYLRALNLQYTKKISANTLVCLNVTLEEMDHSLKFHLFSKTDRCRVILENKCEKSKFVKTRKA